MKPRKKLTISRSVIKSYYAHLLLISIFQYCQCVSNSFKGIPVVFGDLDSDRRTDIVTIGKDGKDMMLYHQRSDPTSSEQSFHPGCTCNFNETIVQVYMDYNPKDPKPNMIVLFKVDDHYALKRVKCGVLSSPELSSASAYSIDRAVAAALKSENTMTYSNFSNNNSIGTTLALKTQQGCESYVEDLNIELKSQPLLFDLTGDLRTHFMGVDKSGNVGVWCPEHEKSTYYKNNDKDWAKISPDFFAGPHSNSFIDINNDRSADIVLSAKGGKIAYLKSDPDHKLTFKNNSNARDYSSSMKPDLFEYGQSTLVDIDADLNIDHVVPRCNKRFEDCEIVVLYQNGDIESIFKFDTNGIYTLESVKYNHDYEFPITLRASDIDGDGFVDFVVLAKQPNNRSVLYLRNIEQPENSNKKMTRTFKIIPIETSAKKPIQLVTLFDVDEDGKVDMLIGSGDGSDPSEMEVEVRLNKEMNDACFMKVMLNPAKNAPSARGAFFCFELNQNDGKMIRGCAGQLSQSSHFSLQQPYVIFGLGETPHFVEILHASVPGFGDRRKKFEQIVPDAQIMITAYDPARSGTWGYALFLSPISGRVLSTLAVLAVLCVLILLIIYYLHRQESKEDAAEHEEYKRHWPESR